MASYSKLTMVVTMSAVGAVLVVIIALLTIRQLRRWRTTPKELDPDQLENPMMKDQIPSNVKNLLALPACEENTEETSS